MLRKLYRQEGSFLSIFFVGSFVRKGMILEEFRCKYKWTNIAKSALWGNLEKKKCGLLQETLP